nr:FAD-dependent oxidoreductase [uncultured Cupriavidus sp.]
MSLETVVVVGAGQAGAWAVRTLRSEGFKGRLVLIGAEDAPPYERPPLSKEQLQRTPPVMQYLISPAELAELGIEWIRSSPCTRIDPSGQFVVLSAGEAIGYDKLILCTGGAARLPTIPGIDASFVHTLRTIKDAERLRMDLEDGVRLLVIGGGWIGLEAAAAARGAGCSVTLVEAAPLLCARTESRMLSAYLARLHRSNDVDVRLGQSIRALDRQPSGGCRAVYTDGAVQEFDAVVVGIGLVHNDGLAREAGLSCDRGILVDQQCRTSDAKIYAAGDVTVMRANGDAQLRLESWQNAQDQGIAAARAVLGQRIHYQPIPLFWSHQYDVLVQIAGKCEPGRSLITRGAESGKLVTVELADDGRVVSVVCANAPREFRQLRKFMAEGVRVDAGRLADATVPLGAVPA